MEKGKLVRIKKDMPVTREDALQWFLNWGPKREYPQICLKLVVSLKQTE